MGVRLPPPAFFVRIVLGVCRIASDPAKVVDQVRFLAGTLFILDCRLRIVDFKFEIHNPQMIRRWSRTARRLPAKQLQVGSTPTGVSSPNTKSEYRNPKQIQITASKTNKEQTKWRPLRLGFGSDSYLDLGFVSDFDIRISDFQITSNCAGCDSVSVNHQPRMVGVSFIRPIIKFIKRSL